MNKAQRPRLALSASTLALALSAAWAAPVAAQQTSPSGAVTPTQAQQKVDSSTATTDPASPAPQAGTISPTAPSQGDGSNGNSSDIVVTASRLNSAGFVAPTPMTVVGVADVARTGATNIGEVINTIPAFRASATPTAGTIGSSYPGSTFLDLRSLGNTRTLVLVDGRRFVPTSTLQQIDINQIPTQLVERTDVVTGGASAAWGSDAVAGVVNVILRKDIQGVIGSIQSGISDRGDGAERGLSVAAGTGFAGGRGHLTLSFEGVWNDGIGGNSRSYANNQTLLISNPAYTPTNGQPQKLITSPILISNATENGLATSGVLRGTEFLGGSSTRPFTFGSPISGSFMVGGSGINLTHELQIATPFERQATFNTLTFDVTPDIHLTLQGSFSHSLATAQSTQSYFPQGTNAIVIRSDNAYLPAAAQAQLLGASQTSFTLGRINTDIGLISPRIDSKTYRGVAALDGGFGGSWKWNAYYEWGKTDYHQQVFNNLLSGKPTSNFFLAVDAVTVTPANVGTSGLTVGNVACRSTLTNPTNGCVPINLFGYGATSKAAIAYVTATQDQSQVLREDAAGATITGEPFHTWAGPVSVAVGAEYRRDAVTNSVDANSLNSQFFLGNPKPIDGGVNVKEAFGELSVPLLKNKTLFRSLELNGAARYTDYSTSGGVTTWKVGGVWDIVDGLRLRATRSRDIRAANLNELYSGTVQRVAAVTDPVNQTTVTVVNNNLGNTSLTPEKADTTTAGVVLEPRFIPGLHISIDYYRIKVNNVITTISAQDTVTRCAAGNTSLCQYVLRNTGGILTAVNTPYINLASLTTNGLDIETSYRVPLNAISASLPGQLNLRALATYVAHLTTNDGVTSVDRAGQTGAANGVPHWQVTGIVNYAVGPASFNLTGRYVDKGVYDATLHAGSGPNSINNNTIPSAFYLNLSGELAVGAKKAFRLFGVVNNILDKQPPLVASSLVNGGVTNPTLFDVVGRYYRVGVRFSF